MIHVKNVGKENPKRPSEKKIQEIFTSEYITNKHIKTKYKNEISKALKDLKIKRI